MATASATVVWRGGARVALAVAATALPPPTMCATSRSTRTSADIMGNERETRAEFCRMIFENGFKPFHRDLYSVATTSHAL
jgi:hypothetical protein